MHPRQEIREKVVALLTGATDCGDNVFASRITPIRKNIRPAISVYTLTEAVAESSKLTAPRELTRQLALAVEVVADATDEVDDILDAIAEQIEGVIAQKDTLDNTVSDVILSGTTIEFFSEGDQPFGALQLRFDVTYYTMAPLVLDGDLDAFTEADVQFDVQAGQQAEDDRPKDVIELEGA